MTVTVQSMAEPLPVGRHGEVDTAVLIIGTGFGGAVSAARLAERWGSEVLVVERGREFLPGQFPETLGEVATEVRGPANPLGLFDVRVGRDLHIVSANGLGGGSLVYATVTLPPHAAVFETRDPATGRRVWPECIDERALREYYARVRSMLAVEAWLDESDVARGGPATPPDLLEGSPIARDILDPAASEARDKYGHTARERPHLTKSEPVMRLAERLGVPSYRPPLAINFTQVADGQTNAHGVTRGMCSYIGSCVTGCNPGAKNSLNTNYLPYAQAHGARVCVGIEVVRLRPGTKRRWAVDAVQRTTTTGRRRARKIRVNADTVVVAAGAAGSTELMLRSRSGALPLSPALGTRMSGNGDAIALSFDGDFRFATAAEDDYGPGPTITFTADIVTAQGRSLVQDGVFPPRVLPQLGRTLALLRRRWRTALRPDLIAAALDRSQVWLAMGTDTAAGRGELDRRRRLRIRWAEANTAPAQRQREAWLVELARLQHADPVLVDDDRDGGESRAAITVHLGGGCPMADDAGHGVVDAAGRVYDPRGGVHNGLFILDGSTCPTSLGSNPSLGIAALTEHALALAAKEAGK